MVKSERDFVALRSFEIYDSSAEKTLFAYFFIGIHEKFITDKTIRCSILRVDLVV